MRKLAEQVKTWSKHTSAFLVLMILSTKLPYELSLFFRYYDQGHTNDDE